MAYGYNKDTDYTKLINQDIARQDWRSAAIHEAQRNEKVLGEGLTQYQTTNHYSDWLPRTEDINSGMDKLAEDKQWSYDAKADPAAQAYRKAYLREADRQTRDTLGNYAQMTGGTPSTAAVSAAQQAGGYLRAQYADKIPELMQADFSRWAAQREQDRSDLTLLAGLDRQRDQDSLQMQQQAIQYAMSRWSQLGAADSYVSSILGVPVGTTTADQAYRQWSQQFQQNQLQQQNSQENQSNAKNYVLYLLQMGIMPSEDQLATAGMSAAEAQQILAYYQSQGNGGNSGAQGNPNSVPREAEPQGPKDEDVGNGNEIEISQEEIAQWQEWLWDNGEGNQENWDSVLSQLTELYGDSVARSVYAQLKQALRVPQQLESQLEQKLMDGIFTMDDVRRELSRYEPESVKDVYGRISEWYQQWQMSNHGILPE